MFLSVNEVFQFNFIVFLATALPLTFWVLWAWLGWVLNAAFHCSLSEDSSVPATGGSLCRFSLCRNNCLISASGSLRHLQQANWELLFSFQSFHLIQIQCFPIMFSIIHMGQHIVILIYVISKTITVCLKKQPCWHIFHPLTVQSLTFYNHVWWQVSLVYSS